jgi:prostaglandin-endoperoxide synthase 2
VSDSLSELLDLFTIEHTANNLTSWGYNDCKADEADGSFGGMISKLLLRHLGEYYPTGSIYAHFPFIVPEKMKDYIANLPDISVGDYAWEKPEVVKRNRSSFETRIMTITKVPIADVSFKSFFHFDFPTPIAFRSR